MKILVTGFEPFDGESLNPSALVAEALPDTLDGAELVKLVLPVAVEPCEAALTAAIRGERPDAVLSLGLAGGRAAVTVERMAVNLDDFRIPDNAGVRRVDVPIDPEGPDGYLTDLPVKDMAAAIRAAGVPAEVSMTAGTYLCNHVLYFARRLAEREGIPCRCGFLHLPWLPEQAAGRENAPGLSLSDDLRAAEAALRAIISG